MADDPHTSSPEADAATSRTTGVVRWRRGEEPTESPDEVALEEPLEIRVRGRSFSVTMRTPGHDAELAAGFLLTESLVRERRDILRIDPCLRVPDGNIINVFLAPHIELDLDRHARRVFASSSCGLCGKASIEQVHCHFPPASSFLRVSAETLSALPDRLRAAQEVFDRTGGLHAAGLFDNRGDLVAIREDVGRHNAVDKALGWAYLGGLLPLSRHILMVSGRASFEIMQKALAAGVPMVAAVSAPSSLAVDFARESNQTLVGFLRGNRMNLYAAWERVEVDKEKGIQGDTETRSGGDKEVARRGDAETG